MKFKPDWFLIGMAAAIALAGVAPGPGAPGGWMHPEVLTKVVVALIFFLHGLRLSLAALREGALNWRLHLLIQAFTFGLFPLVGLALWAGLRGHVSNDLAVGLLYLCALPSTISSAIILTAIAQGNVAGAVFNATLSNLIGVILTPAWIAFALESGPSAQPLGGVILDLVRWLVLPLALGQLARPWLGAAAARHKKAITVIDRTAILLLVYTAFCDSFRTGVWANYTWGQLAFVAALCAVLLAAAMYAITGCSRLLGLPRGDRIAAIFGGSKKTLAAGVPMAKLIFAGQPALGLILLPIMIYHPLQLVICGMLAQRWNEGAEETA